MIKFGLPILFLKIKENWHARQDKQVRQVDPDYYKDIPRFIEGVLEYL